MAGLVHDRLDRGRQLGSRGGCGGARGRSRHTGPCAGEGDERPAHAGPPQDGHVTMTGTATGSGTDVVDVRDGRGDDVVHCGSSRSRVSGDPGDRVAGRCGSVRLTRRPDR